MAIEQAPLVDHSRAMWCHLSAFAGLIFFIPFANAIAPLIVWQTAPVKTAEIEQAGKEALNFQLTMSAISIVVYVVSFILTLVATAVIPQSKSDGLSIVAVLLSVVELIVYAAVVILWLVCVITAGIRSNQGIEYRYPISVRLVK